MPHILRFHREKEGSQNKILAVKEFVTQLGTVLGERTHTKLAVWVLGAEVGAAAMGPLVGRKLWAERM